MSLNPMLRCRAVQEASGNPRSTLYARINQGLFTKPVRLGGRSVGWPAAEVIAINAARVAGQSDDEIRALVTKLEAARRHAGQATNRPPAKTQNDVNPNGEFA